jgi:hypothetical protein
VVLSVWGDRMWDAGNSIAWEMDDSIPRSQTRSSPFLMQSICTASLNYQHSRKYRAGWGGEGIKRVLVAAGPDSVPTARSSNVLFGVRMWFPNGPCCELPIWKLDGTVPDWLAYSNLDEIGMLMARGREFIQSPSYASV